MIVSASRRTDIPALYAEWMINRMRAGFCTVPNPLNRKQVSRISLAPSDVDAIVFWTRNAGPLLAHLAEIDALNLRYYFQYTIVGYPREIDQNGPALQTAVDAFKRLAEHVGPDRLVWRYDPIVFSGKTPPDYHRERFAAIADRLSGLTHRVVISLVDRYRKTEPRVKALAATGAGFLECPDEELASLLSDLVTVAKRYRLEITSCAEDPSLSQYGIPPGKCVDDNLIKQAFGVDVSHRKDPSQRTACGCVVSRDIGMYESCVFGCTYCYATGSFERARINYRQHDPQSPSLIGGHDAQSAGQGTT